MEELHEGFTHFWEILTGVFDDDRSKMLRTLCFFLLFLGCVWAAFNYFKAEKIADLDENLENPLINAQNKRKNETLEKLTEAARIVGTMRKGGQAIANSINEMNSRPFNLDGVEDLNNLVDFVPDLQPAQQAQQEERRDLLVRAVMVSGRTKFAVIDYAGDKGKVVRQGQKLPDGGGNIVRITPEGITVRTESKQEFTYTLNN